MKTEPLSLSRSYLAALRAYLKAGTGNSSIAPARKLGTKAVVLGLETLHIARIHEEALILLVSTKDGSRVRDDIIRRAGIFFAEAITPIEETHGAPWRAMSS